MENFVHILLATGQLFTPQMMGGLQESGNALAQQLKERGHSVSLLASLSDKGFIGLRGRLIMKLFNQRAAKDNVLGYPIWRAWFPWESLEWLVKRIKPDVIIVLARQPVRIAQAANKLGIPVVMMLQDVEFNDHGGSFAELGNVKSVANSQFTADRYEQAFGIKPVVVHPIIYEDKYKTESTRENVTFINPHKLKGLDIALAVAKALPEIPFSFIETWPLTDEERKLLKISLEQLPNVQFFLPVANMQNVYKKCRILIVPSRWEEAYGRVASEAQFSGIPVVASNRGGLPEAVGKGGILLDPDVSIEQWIAAVKQLWNDKNYYLELSNQAYTHAKRPELNIEHQINVWESVINSAIAQK